jgi:tetratricopeptide (TPR) repeat protein
MTETSDPNFRQTKRKSANNFIYPPDAKRWAIIVGISQYKDQSLNLKYADRDAEELYKLLLTPSGGAFKADYIIKLTNEDATTANITRALRSFLKKPAKEDIVLIYFACHGGPDSDRPDIVYLLTHDTEPDDISGTALPMREIDLCLKENLRAERVIVLADTCHSAAIGGGIGRRNIADNTAVVNRYLQEVSKAQGGIALLTSAEANQVAFEDTKWGGGHGVFTYYLLKGMRGEADTSRNGVVSVGELFEYVRKNVQEATDNKQHPCIGANPFDRSLAITVTAGISAQQHYEVGCKLYQLALLLDDRRRFKSASRQLEEALRFAEHPFPEANLQLGLALMADNKIPEAIKAFLAAMKANTLPDAAYYLGIAYAKQGKYESALKYLQSFLTNNSQDKKAPWLREYVAWLSNYKPSNKYALLIGIANYHPKSGLPNLKGPVNDIKSMRELLTEKYAFPPGNITTLADADATYKGILKALGELQSKTLPNDIIVISFGGCAVSSGDVTDGYLVPYDSRTISGQDITVEELHTYVNLTSGNKTLIIDAEPHAELINLARQQGNYTLFLCASLNQVSMEYKSEDGRYFGAFTYNFVEVLRQSSSNIKQGELIGLITNRLQKRFQNRQIPLVIGDKNEYLFASTDYFLKFFDFSQRRNYFPLTLEDIEKCYANFEKNIKAPFPEFYHSLGRAFLEKGNYLQALHCLQTAIDQSGESAADADAIFSLGIAQLRTKHYHDARSTFQRHLTLVESQAYVEQMQEAMAQIEHLETDEKYALLVGIDNDIKQEIPKVSGAVNDVPALQQVLISKYGFQETNIKLLLDTDATYEAIIEEFKKLVKKGQQASALFYFAINSIDGSALNELAALVEKAPTNLITIIDASWNEESSPYVAREETQSQSFTSDIIPEKRDFTNVAVKIGRLSIYQESIEFTQSGNRGVKVEAEFSASQESTGQTIYGELTRTLIKTLQQVNPDTLTYRQLIKNAVKNQESLAPYIVGNNLDEIVFSNAVKEGNLQKLFEKISQEPVKQTIPILQRLIEQRNDIDPEGYLNLGVIYYVLGEYDESIEALEKVVKQQGEQKNADAHYYNADAHYYIGRALFESDRDFARSVSELRQAKQQDPKNPAIYYYLGQAIRALVERETLVEAENAFQYYLNAGAPLGQEDEVRQFLKSRENYDFGL